MFVYKNSNTGDVVERPERSVRLDHLDNWTLIGQPDEAQDVPERPARNASTDAWRAYAVAMGMSEEEAAGRSRDELAALYSEDG